MVAKYYVEIYHQSDPGADGSKIRNISAVRVKSSKDLTQSWEMSVGMDRCLVTWPRPRPTWSRTQYPTCGSHDVPHVWSRPRHCMTLSTNSLCHEFLIPSQPSRQPSRPGLLVQLRKLVCDDCKLANMSATLSSSLKKTPLVRSPRPLECGASTSQLVMEWRRL